MQVTLIFWRNAYSNSVVFEASRKNSFIYIIEIIIVETTSLFKRKKDL